MPQRQSQDPGRAEPHPGPTKSMVLLKGCGGVLVGRAMFMVTFNALSASPCITIRYSEAEMARVNFSESPFTQTKPSTKLLPVLDLKVPGPIYQPEGSTVVESEPVRFVGVTDWIQLANLSQRSVHGDLCIPVPSVHGNPARTECRGPKRHHGTRLNDVQ